jgi:peptidoglycan/LPS O-acetylase OafA/YrhL
LNTKEVNTDGVPAASRARRFPLLDGARIVAALMVVFYHWCFMFYVPDPAVGFKPWPNFVPVAKYGYLGVNLFFMISGFLIVQSAYEKSVLGFLRARVVRLWPAYLACCTLTFVITLLVQNAIPVPEFLYNLTMLNGLIDNFRERVPVFVDGAYWTLAVEWGFYALVAAIIATRQLDHIERLLWLWAAICLGDALYPLRVLDVYLLASWGAYFVAGASFFRGRVEGWNLSRCTLLGVSFCVCLVQAAAFARELTAVHHEIFNSIVVVSIIAMFFGFFAFATLVRLAPKAGSRALTTAGALSYPIYLLHQQIGAVTLPKYWSFSGRYFLLCAALVVLMVLSTAVHFGVELPIWARLRAGAVARSEGR